MTTELNEAPTAEDVLQMDLDGLRDLSLEDFPRKITLAEVRHIFETCNALWLHSGDPRAPHAELTSGKCSDGFVDVLRVLRYTNLCGILADQLVTRLANLGPVDWVIGSDHAGATLSFAVASLLYAQHDFTEKGDGKSQVWKRFVIQPEEIVLQVEELVTTTGTLQAVRDGIRTGNPHPVKFAPLVLTLVHRSNVYSLEDTPIVPLVHYDIQTWDPTNCPLCRAGSERVRPKQNWAKLTGR